MVATVHVITGPPASGKSTFVREHRRSGDVTIDFDDIANAIGGKPAGNHEHDDVVRAVSLAARRAAIDSALRQDCTVWLIHSSPSESALEKYRELGAEIHVVDPGKDVVMARIKHQRPEWMLKIAGIWYSNHRKAPAKRGSAAARGYGRSHRADRDRLLWNHVDGSSCWWCGKPMFTDRTKNWDYDPSSSDPHSGKLHADHSNKDERADRLLHERCNKSRGDGSRDHNRPALVVIGQEAEILSGETFQWG